MIDAVQLLRSHGLRVTPQRIMLIEVASTLHGHFTADEVHSRIAARYPSVSVVSVYRGLETLHEHGLVSHTDMGEAATHYEWAGSVRHHHLLCTVCGAQYDLQDDELDELRGRLVERYGFEANMDHLAIFGRCAVCAAQPSPERTP